MSSDSAKTTDTDFEAMQSELCAAMAARPVYHLICGSMLDGGAIMEMKDGYYFSKEAANQAARDAQSTGCGIVTIFQGLNVIGVLNADESYMEHAS